MSFLRRILGGSGGGEPDPANEAEAIAGFWAWWAGKHDELAARIEGRGMGPAQTDEITKAVRRVHPRMAWELGTGHTARYALILTPEGDPEVRPVALRWLATAPRADETWEYFAARQAGQRGQLIVDGHGVDLDEMRTVPTWDATRRLMDVRVWHPAFPTLPAPVRQKVAMLFFDGQFGEDEVERWIGAIEVADADPGPSAIPPDALVAELDARRTASAAADDTWVLGQGELPDGRPVFVVADAALKRIDHPLADHHLAVRIAIGGGRGLPDDGEAQQLNAAEDALAAELGSSAVLAGRATVPGERTIHFATAEPEAAASIARAWAARHPDRQIRIETALDPHWTFRRDLLG